MQAVSIPHSPSTTSPRTILLPSRLCLNSLILLPKGRNPPKVYHSINSPEMGKDGLLLQDYLDPETKCLGCCKNKWGRCNSKSVEQLCGSCTKYRLQCRGRQEAQGLRQNTQDPQNKCSQCFKKKAKYDGNRPCNHYLKRNRRCKEQGEVLKPLGQDR